MTMKLLGATLDIHGGGLDLQFPHHENELAQSESFTGQTFVRYWLHNGLMKIRSQSRKIKDDPTAPDGELEKMSKSLGNEIVVSKVFEKHAPETLRFLLLSTHYRSQIEYSEDRLNELKRALDGFYRFFERYQRITGQSFQALSAPAKRGEFLAEGPFLLEVAKLRDRFLDCMDDDFNTGGAIGVLNELLTALNRCADQEQLETPGPKTDGLKPTFQRGVTVLRELSQLLGLFVAPPAKKEAAGDGLANGLMQLLIDLRAECRKTKNFAMADMIRQRLTALGVTLEDRQGGTSWRVG
jgi:cysteinyl-tRNA synthetase